MTKYFLILLGMLTVLSVANGNSASGNQKSKKVILDKYGNHNKRNHLFQPCGPQDGHDLRNMTRFYLPVHQGGIDEPVTFSSGEAIRPFYEIFEKQCTNDSSFEKLNKNWLKMLWRYKLYEDLHCLRVELDLGNITHFRKTFNYTYYVFSYRELGKKNIFLKRQAIEESKNSLIIRHANLRPYIICISFYKDDLYKYDTPAESVNGTNRTYDASTTTPATSLSCDQRAEMLRQDVPGHDLAMCIDIDTPEHFLEIHKHSLEHRGFNPELIMVLFIVGLLIFMLFAISIINFILVEKPLEKKRKRLGQFVQRKLNSSADHSAALINSRDSLSRNNSKLQLAKDNAPSITINDFSSNKSLQNSNAGDESKETDGLLVVRGDSFNQNAVSSLLTTDSYSQGSNVNQNMGHKVTFQKGETII